MTREEFNKEVAEINGMRVRGEIGPLGAGCLFRELCQKWLETHSELPEGFKGFANLESLFDRPVHF